MGNKFLKKLFSLSVPWLDGSGKNSIALSCRVRLARNLAGFYFPARGEDAALDEVRQKVRQALQEISTPRLTFGELAMEDLSAPEKLYLLESRYISKEFLNGRKAASLFACPEEGIYIMVNEEDHLRLQILSPGASPEKIRKKLFALDQTLGKKLNYAWDPSFGYLTSCPTNLGTGLRASFMLHLPALTLSGEIQQLSRGLQKLGLVMRGIYGEGSKSIGNLYQISNQSTLGESEEEIFTRLKNVIESTVEREKARRQVYLAKKKEELYNFAARSYGLLRYSYFLTGEEALHALSGLRLGVDLGMFEKLSTADLDSLFLLLQEAHICRDRGLLTAPERGKLRAEIFRNALTCRN